MSLGSLRVIRPKANPQSKPVAVFFLPTHSFRAVQYNEFLVLSAFNVTETRWVCANYDGAEANCCSWRQQIEVRKCDEHSVTTFYVYKVSSDRFPRPHY